MFPQCWDGGAFNVKGGANMRHAITDGSGGLICPSGFDTYVPQLAMFVDYNLPGTAGPLKVLGPNGVAMEPDFFHADYFNSEDLESLVQLCIREGQGATLACGAGRGSEEPTAPVISSVSPADQTQNIALNTNVEATFSKDMDPSTLTTSTFTLTKQGSSTPVAGKVSYSSTTKKATLDPSSDLASNATYTATIRGGTSGAKDSAGNALAQDYSWTFRTVSAPPSVASYTPTQTTGVPMNTYPTAAFSTDMDDSTITSANIKFEVYNKKKKKWISVAHTVSYDAGSRIATVTPGSSLAASKKYRVTITTDVKSSTGVALDQDDKTSGNQPKTWTFTTGST
jgi:hypothetical protein